MRRAHDFRQAQVTTRIGTLRMAAMRVAVALLIASMALFSPIQSAHAATVKTVYGVSRSEIVSWLESHENDSYYLGTPYKPYDWRSPNGDINKWGANSDGVSAGMNCTGFVWHVLCAAHGWKDDIATKLPALTGWKTEIDNNDIVTYTFDTKEDMLASGKLRKGDVIWMWDGGDPNKTSNHHHVAIFWGDASDEDKMWHSSGDSANNWVGENAITEIHGKAPSVSYQVVKVSEEGAISLKKVSSDPDVTDGNDSFSLKGAEYGVFATKEKAKTHDGSKAIKTYKTNASGKFTTAMDYVPGTYYVAETAASKGFELDDKVYEVAVEAYKTTKVNGGSVSEKPELGGFSLEKRSSSEDVTKGNSDYSLKGAQYGLFSSKANAKTHDAAKAIDTYTTDADGKLATEIKYAAGTYYVAETKASKGYTLDEDVYEVAIQPGKISKVNGGVVYESPGFGGFSLEKRSSNDATKNNSHYSLQGAKYGLFSSKSNASTHDAGKAIDTHTTDADGKFTTTMKYAAGTYYVAETNASKGYILDEDVYEVAIQPGKIAKVNGGVVYEAPGFGGFSLEKRSSNDATNNNRYYSVEGARYGLFSSKADAKTHEAGKAIDTYATDSNGKLTTEMKYVAGTYYVAETKASKGFELDEEAYETVIEPGKITKVNSGAVKENPILGAIAIEKRSSNEGLSKDNGCYSLKGARYGVYTSQDAARTRAADKAERVYETQANGAFEGKRELIAGTRYVTEIAAPAGYAMDTEIYTVEVLPGETTKVGSRGYVSDSPQNNPVTLWAAKTDRETADGRAQGSATLEGALFQISYYDGYYDLTTLPKKAKRTWTVKTDAEGKAHVRDDLKVSGDEFYRTSSGQITIPLGTVTVCETGAPRGYLVEDGSSAASKLQLVQIKPRDNSETVKVYTAFGVKDNVKRGGLRIGKTDRQHAAYLPQGSATLEGATFNIVSNNAQQVMVGGTRYTKGSVVATIKTKREDDGRFIASTTDDALPVGSYTVSEVASTTGYLFDSQSKAYAKTFEITENKQVVDLTNPQQTVSNLVIRGDFGFTKADGQTGARLGLVPFMVTSTATGEKHVIVTDENGMFSTATSWNPHSQRTNANDKAVTETSGRYEVDAGKLDAAAGVWFHGRKEATCSVDDSLGALPYDTYSVQELHTAANDGYEMAEFEVRISRNARELELGTVDDNAGPLIQTSTANESGVQLVAADESATVTDTVFYQNLDMRKTYTLAGSIHLVSAEGGDEGVVAETTRELKPRSSMGSVDMEIPLDTSQLIGSRLVVFEQLVNQQDVVVATHEELLDEGQTLRVPGIATTLAKTPEGQEEDDQGGSDDDSSNEDGPDGNGAGETGSDGDDADNIDTDDDNAAGKPRSDSEDKPGTPGSDTHQEDDERKEGPGSTKDDGSSASADNGKTPEDAENGNGREGDSSDEASAPSTSASGNEQDAEGASAEIDASGTIQLTDTVHYRGLKAGVTYTLVGVLHTRGDDGSDEGAALDEEGAEIQATQTFVAEAPEGDVDVPFAFRAPDLAGKTTVAFEELVCGGKAYAVHADISDEGQSVTFAPPEPTPPEEPTPEEPVPEEPTPENPTPDEPTPEEPTPVEPSEEPAPNPKEPEPVLEAAPAPETPSVQTGSAAPTVVQDTPEPAPEKLYGNPHEPQIDSPAPRDTAPTNKTTKKESSPESEPDAPESEQEHPFAALLPKTGDALSPDLLLGIAAVAGLVFASLCARITLSRRRQNVGSIPRGRPMD